MVSSDPRIEKVLRSDRRGIAAFVVALWLTILFVYAVAWQAIPDPTVRLVLAVSVLILLVLNTASMTALARHYEEDKENIYGLDIHFLDVGRRQKAGNVSRRHEGQI